MSTLKFSVQSQSINSTQTQANARNFQMTIDEPASLGGTDAGANPVEYLLAALSGCLNVVGHLIAKEMGISMRGIAIDLEGELDPGKFMGKTTAGRAGYMSINVTIRPDCDADQATLQKWLQAVESRCPVSDNIGNTTPLQITLG